jgi:hypothetical protein
MSAMSNPFTRDNILRDDVRSPVMEEMKYCNGWMDITEVQNPP